MEKLSNKIQGRKTQGNANSFNSNIPETFLRKMHE